MNRDGDVFAFSDLNRPDRRLAERDIVVQDIEPAHARHPRSFVLSANGERYENTRSQRRKARKAARQSRKRNR